MLPQRILLVFVAACAGWGSRPEVHGAAPLSELERQLFEKAFGADAANALPANLQVELVINGELVGEVKVVHPDPLDKKKVVFESKGLYDALKGGLNSEMQTRLREMLAGKETVDFELLKTLGWDVDLDLSKVHLALEIPGEQRSLHAFRYNILEPSTQFTTRLEPEDFSAYVNFWSGVSYVWEAPLGSKPGVEPVSLSATGAARLSPVALEWESGYNGAATTPIQLQGVRLIYDQPEQMRRWALGDVYYTTTGFQQLSRLGGVAVGRQWGLQPYRLATPQGDVSFLLNEPTEVEVYAGGRRLQSSELKPGPYTFSDFPLVYGENEIEVLLRGRSGQVQVIRQSIFYDTRLLAAGLFDYGLTAGVPSQSAGVWNDYSVSQPLSSGFIRWPWGARDTLGVNGQANVHRQMVGADWLNNSRLGVLTADGAFSFWNNELPSPALRLGYRLAQELVNPNYMSAVSLNMAYTGRGFATLVDGPVNNSTWLSSGLALTLPTFARIRASLGVNYQWRRDSFGDAQSVYFNLGRSFKGGWSARAGVSKTFGPKQSANDYQANLSINWTPRPTRINTPTLQSWSTSYQYPQNTATASWQESVGSGMGASSYGVEMQGGDSGGQAVGQARYFDERANVGFSHRLGYDTFGNTVSQRSRLDFSSGIAYAGGVFGIGQPVSDGFVLVPRAGAGELVPLLTQNGDPQSSWSSRWDFLGPRVLSGAASYRINGFSIIGADYATNRTVEEKSFSFKPAYRGGGVVKMEDGGTVRVSGRLLNEAGKPVGLRAAQFEGVVGAEAGPGKDPGPATPKKREPILVVVDEAGLFETAELKPGSYEITVFGEPIFLGRVVIPKQKAAVRLGDISLKAKPGSGGETEAPEEEPPPPAEEPPPTGSGTNNPPASVRTPNPTAAPATAAAPTAATTNKPVTAAPKEPGLAPASPSERKSQAPELSGRASVSPTTQPDVAVTAPVKPTTVTAPDTSRVTRAPERNESPVVAPVPPPTAPPPTAPPPTAPPPTAPIGNIPSPALATLVDTAPKPSPPAASTIPSEIVQVPEPPTIRPAQEPVTTPTLTIPPPTEAVAPVCSPNSTPALPVAAEDSSPNVVTGRAPAATTEAEGTELDASKRSLWAKAKPVNWFKRDHPATPATNSSKRITPVEFAPSDPTAAAPAPASVVTPPPVRKPRPREIATLPPSRATEPTATPSIASAVPTPVVVQKPAFEPYRRQVTAVPSPGDRPSAEKEFETALAAHRNNDLAAATTGYQQAIALDPAYFEAQYNLSLAAVAQNNLPVALRSAETAMVLRPADVAARYQFAVVLQRSRHPIEAAAEMEEIARLLQTNSASHLVAATLYANDLQEPDRARPHYEKVLALEPAHPQAASIRRWLAANPARSTRAVINPPTPAQQNL